MKSCTFPKILAVMLVVAMFVCMLPINAFAATIDFDADGVSTNTDDYYKLISRRDWELAPGIDESEIILNNEAGSLRQVTHVVEVDLNNPYTKVIPGYKGMVPTPGNYGIQSVSEQAAFAEANGYGNVVAATNCSLSWYNDAYYKANPHLIGEPLGYMILDGQMFVNSRGQTSGAVCCIVINANERNGEARPADMPRVTIRSTSEAITGWEEQVIPVNFTFLVKDTNNDGIGENQYIKQKNHTSGFESRTFVGVKADGTLVVAVVDGRQAPYSAGFNNYEMADYMLKLGCVVAANCDGGGSTEFMSQRPGEDLKINCSLSDGGERPTTNSILIISTAPSTGEFTRASLSTEYDYYAPGSSVTFNAVGSDLVGTPVDVPENVEWTIKETDMGTISHGVFVSNGKEGTVTAQLLYDGKVVGERSIEIIVPTSLSFTQPVVTIPYGKTARIPVKATIENGLKEVSVDGNAVSFVATNTALGRFDGINFIAVTEDKAPADITSVVTATLVANPSITATVNFKLGKESVILEDFENGIGDWKAIVQRNVNEAHRDFVHDLSIATKEDGQVHDGEYSLRLQTNGLSSSAVHSQQYAYVRLGIPSEEIILENARGLGFWLYVPDDNIQCWVQGYYRYDTNGDGTFDTLAEVNLMNSENVYYNVDESGWHYMYMDLSGQEKVVLGDKWNVDPANPTGTKGDFFIAIIFHKSINNQLWQTNGSINGPFTYYLDTITVDYSDAVVDREAPVFGKIFLGNNEMKKHAVVTTTNNVLNISANVTEATERVAATGETSPLYNYTGINANSVKAFIDGVEVPSTYLNGQISISNVAVADGYHRVKFEVCDNAGNKSVKVRLLKVESGVEAPTIQFVPVDPTLDRIFGGSVYWMDMKATAIETIKSVTAEIDLNSVNHWELDHMELADGFTSEYTINDETNTATITITRTGKNTQTGSAVLAKLPVRIVYFDTDMKIPGYTAETFWKNYNLWPHDLKLDIDKGVITFVDGYTSSVLNTFSNEEFQVDTEIYTDAQSMDVAYREERGTAHVHTPASIDNKEPTCTQPGYTNRTYCDICDSVVDWGTTVSATGHSYKVAGKQLVCDCGDIYTENGLVNIGGKAYYIAAGSLSTGWLTIDDVWYYFNDTFDGANGQLTYNGVTYEFENGRLKNGVWVNDGVGSKYYYGPANYICKNGSPYANVLWAEIDGKTYGFDKQGYRHEGLRVLVESSQDAVLYKFTDEGVLEGVYNPGVTGLYQCNGMLAYLKNGVPFPAGLVLIDNDYYYFNTGCIAVVGSYNVTRPNGLLPAGVYVFGEDGKMVDPPQRKNGPYYDGYFYLNDVKQTAYQLIEFEGNYYFINDGNMLAKNTRIYLSSRFTSGTNLTPGYYQFDDEGKMVIPNGPQDDGYFYINGVKQLAYQIIEFEGDYYFINDSNKYAVNKRIYLSSRFTDGTVFKPGYYVFDAEGKMQYKHGPNEDGYFYLNGIKQLAYQIVEFEGEYYFINDSNKYAVNKRIYLSSRFTDGTVFKPGYYEFDEDGKMQYKHGPNEDGFFYLFGVKQLAYQIVEFEGNYYFVNDSNKLAKNKRLYLSSRFTDGTVFKPGYYEFDANGKMQYKHGPNEDGFFYLFGVKQLAYQIVEFEGNYYFVGDSNKLAKNKRLYLSSRFTDGTKFEPGYYDFDSEGKMVLLDGPQSSGYFYLDGVMQKSYQLIQYNGEYYFIDNGNKYAKNKKLHLNDVFLKNTYLLPGYYEFDAQGRMIGHKYGLFNGRDLGDIPFLKTTDGRDIKSGLLIRGGEVDNAILNLPKVQRDESLNALKNIYNVKMDLDLRSPNLTKTDVLGESVLHKYYGMVLYDEAFTEEGKAVVKEIFTDLANPDNYPIYMHCTHGADRVGTVCYILESVLGVSEDLALREYLLSVRSYGNYILEVRDGLKAYNKSTMKANAEAYLLDCGVTMEQIETIREIFLEN